MPGYIQAAPYEDIAPGEHRHGIACAQLDALTVPDEALDLILTSDVMEHRFDVDDVVAETRRVLRPGGAHIFTVPLAAPLRHQTRIRARMGPDGIEHLAAPRYEHHPYDDPSLVVSDFGADLVHLHARHGLHVRFFRAMSLSRVLRDSAVVIARRLA